MSYVVASVTFGDDVENALLLMLLIRGLVMVTEQ